MAILCVLFSTRVLYHYGTPSTISTVLHTIVLEYRYPYRGSLDQLSTIGIGLSRSALDQDVQIRCLYTNCQNPSWWVHDWSDTLHMAYQLITGKITGNGHS